jgi:hypothetical protein
MRALKFLVTAWGCAFATLTQGQGHENEGLPAFNDLFARTIIIEVMPLVEKYTGWKMADVPKFRLVTMEEFATKMAPPLAEQIRQQNSHLSEAKALEFAKNAVRTQSAGTLGVYIPRERTIFFLPRNLEPAFKRARIEHRFSRDLIEVVIAHEVTHAIQDAHHPLDAARAACADDEERAAFAMLVEGHATFVQEKVAAELRISEAAANFADRLVAQMPTGRSEVERYVDGKKFVEAAFAKGGLGLVQRLFTKPPRARLHVREPEMYFLTDGRSLIAPPGAK